MAYVIADTRVMNQKLYAFDSISNEIKLDWNLVRVNSTEYDLNGSILITPEVLQELQDKGVAIFETKKAAKSCFLKLSIANCRYVELKLKISHEAKLAKDIGFSTWTELNNKALSL